MTHISRSARAEMMRAHAGLVTTMVSGDENARDRQLAAIVAEHVQNADGNVGTFTGLMGKQVEAGAHVTFTVLRLLAKRLNMTAEETQATIAQAIAALDEDAFPE